MDTATISMGQHDSPSHGQERPISLATQHEDDPQQELPDTLYDLRASEKQAEIIQQILKLQNDLIDKSSDYEKLIIKLDERNRTVETLSQELNECKLAILQNNEDSKKVHEEVQKNKKLEEDYIILMSNFLNLNERYEQDRRDIYDKFVTKQEATGNLDVNESREVIAHELAGCKAELELKLADTSLLSAKLRDMEEDNLAKDKWITELKKSLEDAKVAHKHEITVLEDYIQGLKNTITTYERTLATYIDNGTDKSEDRPSETVDRDGIT